MGSIRQHQKNCNVPRLAASLSWQLGNTFQQDAWLHSSHQFPPDSPPVLPSPHVPISSHGRWGGVPPAYESRDINWRTKAPECHGWFRSYISGLVPRRLMQVETERDSAEAHVTLMGGSDNNPIKGRIYCVRFSIQTTS